ncbi:hypothetical protein [uncultured Microbacterium sp.]|uniref:hypothetical protein n=1 Tax=uncultured Microbacterium sp. TaxID=191216 RepID=UPI0035CA5EFC
MARRSKRARGILIFVVLTALPILLAAAGTGLGLLAAVDANNAVTLRVWAISCAVLVAVLLVIKAVRDYRWGQTIKSARYDAVRELHDRLGPALGLMTEMPLLEPDDRESKKQILRTIATHCCSALVAMTPESVDVRAVVFALQPPDDIVPLAQFGRSDSPRSFSQGTTAGEEIFEYLESGRNPKGELYTDTGQTSPEHYEGDAARYQTFIRTPIRGSGVVFGMLTVDAPKPDSLSDGDVRLAELVAAELGTAFAIAASSLDVD